MAKKPTEKLLELVEKEIEEQVKDLKAERKAGSPHKIKLANAIGSLGRVVINISAEQRQQEKDESRAFKNMTLDRRNELLFHHLDELDNKWLERFRDRCNELLGTGSVLG